MEDNHSINVSKRKTIRNPPSPLQSEPPFSSNSTFMTNSEDEDNYQHNRRPCSEYFHIQAISEEELKIREELGMEIEKELEREIMEGITVLVLRLSELKAKQISRASNLCHLCGFNNGINVSDLHILSPMSVSDHEYVAEEEDNDEGLDIKS